MAATKVSPASARDRARARDGRPPKHTSAQIAEALRRADGICNQAAKRLRIDPTTLRRRLAREPKLAAIRADARELLLDDVDAAFAKMIRTPSHKGHVQAVIAYAKLQGQGRGYVSSHLVDATVEGRGVPMTVLYDGSTDPDDAVRRAKAKLRRDHPDAVAGVCLVIPKKAPLPGDELEEPEDGEPTAESADDMRPEERADEAATSRTTDLEDDEDEDDEE